MPKFKEDEAILVKYLLIMIKVQNMLSAYNIQHVETISLEEENLNI